jgi:hypothetical protein
MATRSRLGLSGRSLTYCTCNDRVSRETKMRAAVRCNAWFAVVPPPARDHFGAGPLGGGGLSFLLPPSLQPFAALRSSKQQAARTKVKTFFMAEPFSITGQLSTGAGASLSHPLTRSRTSLSREAYHACAVNSPA